MDILKSYLSELKKALPRSERNEVVRELESSILDELDQTGNTKENLEKILVSMGSPYNVAQQYNTNRVVPSISKGIEPLYKLLIKVVPTAVAFAVLLAHTVGYIFDTNSLSIAELITLLALAVPDIIMAMITSIGMITVVIYIVDRSLTFKEKDFKISDLPTISTPKSVVNVWVEGIKLLAQIGFVVFINLDIDASFNGQQIFANLSNVVTILTVLILIDICFTVASILKGHRDKIFLRIMQVKEFIGAFFLIYLSTITVFNPEFEMIPSFTSNIIRIVFFVIGIVTLFEAYNITKEA